ncbi:uncharacterized protein G2W53_014945 [Senna tora]|uniref:Uncharacterized protein n=1 Tax=Senna tora TaxID=362788 RepID=A0A834WUM6_9FABA|nr:uncharacterized protein G2W53_014945 [Senna tora]
MNSIILFIHNIYTSSTRQEPVENPKQSRAHLFNSPEAHLHFLRQDLLQQDNGAERSNATRRQRREICPVAMDPPSMVELLLLMLYIPQYDFNLKVLARQEPVENPKQSRARDFPHLPPNQTLPLPRRWRLLLLHFPEALLRFLQQDLLQRDDDAEKSDATRRQRREICPVAMDPPSMVRVFAVDESV